MATKAPVKAAPQKNAVVAEQEPEELYDDPQLLYQPVPQLEDPSELKESRVWVTPEMARQWLAEADNDPQFMQRKIVTRELKRWKLLIETGRFVHYLPNGPLCFDDTGLLINGKHRLMACESTGRPIGMIVYNNVPRWMFTYFDSGKTRTLADAAFVASLDKLTPQQSKTIRGAMRYEEFLAGRRRPLNWKEWGAVQRDEHADVINFAKRREGLLDLAVTAVPLGRARRILPQSLQIFRFYQELAWPDGADKIAEFWAQLDDGSFNPREPGDLLRSWAHEAYMSGQNLRGARELHYLLLFRVFGEQMRGDHIAKTLWAYGRPMELPYHPDGPVVAHETLSKALSALDKEAAA